MRSWLDIPTAAGLDSRAAASRGRHPAGIEPSSLRDRRVGTERFLGRRASARQSADRKARRPDPVRLFGAARPGRARHRCPNHPGAARG